MRYHFMLFICVSFCDGFPNIADDEEKEINPCNPNPCKNDGSCIVRSDLSEGHSCSCINGYGGKTCEIDPCKSNPCKNGGSCILRSDMPEGYYCSCVDGYGGKTCETDQCSLECRENQVCVIENGIIECKIEDPCKSNPCKNGGSCIANSYLSEGFVCSCRAGYIGETCNTDLCSILPCGENEDCVIENGVAVCKLGDLCSQHECRNGGICLVEDEYAKCICTESFRGVHCELREDTLEDLATTTPITVTSTTTITTRKEKYNKTTTPEDIHKLTVITETSNTDQLLRSSSIETKSTTALTKATTKITKTTKNEVATSTRVSFSDLSSTSVERTSETNTDYHHKHFTVTPSSPIVGNTTSFDNNTIKTSHTLTDGLTTIEYATTTDSVFKSSSQTSPKISSYSSTSKSTSASPDNSGYISERPQIIVSTSTESKEKTEITNFKSSGSYVSTTETLNITSATNHDSGNDINRTNASSQTITIYASVGTVCLAVLVAFAVGGWYIRRM